MHTSYHNGIVTTSKVDVMHIIKNKVKGNNSNVEPDSSPQT